MQNFEYYSPCKNLVWPRRGRRSRERARRIRRQPRFLVFGGGSVVRSGLLQRVEASLDAAGLQHEAFGGAKPNPLVSHAREGVKKALAFGERFHPRCRRRKRDRHGKSHCPRRSQSRRGHLGILAWSSAVNPEPAGRICADDPAAGSETSNSAVLTNEETGESVVSLRTSTYRSLPL